MSSPLPIVVLISGNGSNLQAIIDAIEQQTLAATICAVISNKEDAYGLVRAKQQQIPTHVIANKEYADRNQYDRALLEVIEQYQPKLVILAGFMRILTDGFVDHFTGRLLNIHPSLLPKYRGLHTHEQVLAAGDKFHGVTVHFVNKELDGGPIICQAKLAVCADDTVDALKTRVHALEHRVYPLVIQWFANSRLSLKDQQVWLDNDPLSPTGCLL